MHPPCCSYPDRIESPSAFRTATTTTRRTLLRRRVVSIPQRSQDDRDHDRRLGGIDVHACLDPSGLSGMTATQTPKTRCSLASLPQSLSALKDDRDLRSNTIAMNGIGGSQFLSALRDDRDTDVHRPEGGTADSSQSLSALRDDRDSLTRNLRHHNHLHPASPLPPIEAAASTASPSSFPSSISFPSDNLREVRYPRCLTSRRHR